MNEERLIQFLEEVRAQTAENVKNYMENIALEQAVQHEKLQMASDIIHILVGRIQKIEKIVGISPKVE